MDRAALGRRKAVEPVPPARVRSRSARISRSARRTSSARATSREHRVRILGLAEAAVITAERAEVVALLDVQVVAQDHAAVAQVGAQAEQVVAAARSISTPVRTASPACSRARRPCDTAYLRKPDSTSITPSTSCGSRPGARRLVLHGLQQLDALLAIGDALAQPLGHLVHPAMTVDRALEIE